VHRTAWKAVTRQFDPVAERDDRIHEGLRSTQTLLMDKSAGGPATAQCVGRANHAYSRTRSCREQRVDLANRSSVRAAQGSVAPDSAPSDR